MTIAQLPPFDLRVVYPWMQPDAVFAAHFEQGQYWLDGAKGPIAASSLLTTTRSSGIVLPDSAGVFQTLGNNTLPRTDRGLYGNGQITNLLGRSNPTVAQVSSISNIVDGPGFAGFPHSIYYGGGMGGSNSRHFQVSNFGVNGQPYTASVLVQMLDGNPPVFGSATVNNAANTFYLQVGNFAANPQNYIVEQVGPDIWKVIAKGTFVVNGGVFGAYQGSDNQPRAFNLCGTQCFIGDISPAAIVPGTQEAGGPTLMASDIRAVQGVRPSNAQPEPFPGWEAAGLDDGFTASGRVNIDRLSAASFRTIFQAGSANEFARLDFTTGNRFRMTLQTLGTELRGDGVTGLVGTAAAAAYNTGTGAGTASRVDISNQSFVQWSGLTAASIYLVDIENTGSTTLGVRSGGETGTNNAVFAGQRTTVSLNPSASGLITITSGPNGSTSNFIVHSFREVKPLTLESGVVSATGFYDISARFKPGDYALTVSGGIAGDSDSSSEPFPAGATTLRVGSNFGVLNPFNGWISEIQIARAA